MDGLEHRTPPNGQAAWSSGAPALEGPITRQGHRRLSPAGMRAALATSLAVLGLLAVHTLGFAGRLTAWVHAQPAYTFGADSITLEPRPPAWIKSGERGLTHQAGASLARFEGRSALDLELPAVTRAFKNLVWVDRVERVERAYPNKLMVRLDFRRPVAYADFKVGPNGPAQKVVRHHFDGTAALLPGDDLDTRALPPIIPIVGIAAPADTNPGAAWVEHVEGKAPARASEPDPRPDAAVRLATFVLKKFEAEGWPAGSDGRPWQILAITLQGNQPADRLHLIGPDGKTWVLWGDAPGLEPPGRPTAEEKWRNLRDLVSKPIPRESGKVPAVDLTESRVAAQWRLVPPRSTRR